MRVRGRRVAHPACSPFAYSILSVRRSTVARRSLQLRCRNNADAEKGLGSARFRKSTRCPLSRFAGLVRARFWGNGRWAPRSGTSDQHPTALSALALMLAVQQVATTFAFGNVCLDSIHTAG